MCKSFLSFYTIKDGWFMVFNTTFNNISVISWRSVFLLEETDLPGENQHNKRKNYRIKVFNTNFDKQLI